MDTQVGEGRTASLYLIQPIHAFETAAFYPRMIDE
jgi:hypothetical protein